MKHLAYKEKDLRRTSKLSVMLNSREMRALGIYCSRYRIKNKSEFLRVTLMKAIIQRFEDEHPSLWEDQEPTLFDRREGRKVFKVS
ncbi:MAG TPA: hypothetical protein PKM76_13725 [Bacteroidales bacterium]|jgi:hypothetical protein|nr:hypothetical protein [Bacteroidales bacterium]